MKDIKECYEVMEQSAWELDRSKVATLVMESQSWAATYVLIGWFALTEGRVDRSKASLARAEASCESEEDLAYVLHIESIAFLRMGDTGKALEKEDACLALCRKTKNPRLAAQVLVQLGAISHALGQDGLNRARLQGRGHGTPKKEKKLPGRRKRGDGVTVNRG